MMAAGWQTDPVLATVLLAADPHAFAPISASVCAIAVFVILVFFLAPGFGGADEPTRPEREARDTPSDSSLDDGDAAEADADEPHEHAEPAPTTPAAPGGP